ncbi:GLUG motif-containing protein [Vaginella massiliensis]|uniref:GLUG motif-containing protein n=1 Tax=Vaginella massiliensis TaxID=1816680 RepID=UPI0037536F4E
MKKTLLSILAVTTLFVANAQYDYIVAPNVYKSKTTKKNFDLKANLPTSNWMDHADVSWYNESQTNFELRTADQLAGLAKLVYDGNKFTNKTIKLSADIDLAQHLWTPIGYDVDKPFSGTFDGGNHTIKNVQVVRENGDFIGLFGQVYQGHLKNTKVENVYLRGRDTLGGFVSNLSTNSSAENCHVSGADIVATGYNAGGFVGGLLTDSSVHNSSAEGNVSGVNQIGGFVGTPWDNTTITESFAKGKVSGEYIIGGFAGMSTLAFLPNRINTIKNSYALVDVAATAERAGGFVGSPQFNMLIENVYVVGKVNSPHLAGAFAGLVGPVQINKSYYNQDLNNLEAVAGFEYGETELDIQGKTTSFMKSQAMVDLLNSYGEELWAISQEVNDGYPYLKAQNNMATQDFGTSIKLSVYPTWATDYINVESSAIITTYQIVDATGKKLMQQTAGTKQTKVNVHHLPKGVYYIVINTEKGKSSSKFIKK